MKGHKLVLVVVAAALLILLGVWFARSQSKARDELICDKVDALTAALVIAGTEASTEPMTESERTRLDNFIDAAACDPEKLQRRLEGVLP